MTVPEALNRTVMIGLKFVIIALALTALTRSCDMSTPAHAGEVCLTPELALDAVPTAEQTEFDAIELLDGPVFTQWIRYLDRSGVDWPDDATAAMAFYKRQKGHGQDVRMVWFKDDCAIGKSSLPAQIWLVFAGSGEPV